MEQEQVLNTTIQENPSGATEPENQPVETLEPEVKMYSEEEFKKAVQSAAGKAKYELLQELGISSVKEFKETYQTKLAEHDTLNKSYQELKEAYENEQKKNLLANVDEEFRDEALILARAKATDGDLEKAMQEVLNKNPNWRLGSKDIKIGTEKHDHEVKELSTLSKKYSWIK